MQITDSNKIAIKINWQSICIFVFKLRKDAGFPTTSIWRQYFFSNYNRYICIVIIFYWCNVFMLWHFRLLHLCYDRWHKIKSWARSAVYRFYITATYHHLRYNWIRHTSTFANAKTVCLIRFPYSGPAWPWVMHLWYYGRPAARQLVSIDSISYFFHRNEAVVIYLLKLVLFDNDWLVDNVFDTCRCFLLRSRRAGWGGTEARNHSRESTETRHNVTTRSLCHNPVHTLHGRRRI